MGRCIGCARRAQGAAPREDNAQADLMSNRAIDERL